MLTLALVSLVVGFLCGCTSIGGILLIPAMALCGGIGLREAMATTLFSFLAPSVVASWLHWRNGTIDWRVGLPLALGAICFGSLGAFAKEQAEVSFLSALLAALIIVAGLNVLFPLRAGRLDVAGRTETAQRVFLFALGAVVSFMAGLTGAGGPVLTVPIMIGTGFSPLLAVAVAQPFQVVAAVSGSVGNVILGSVDYGLALVAGVTQIIGIAIGIRMANRLNTERLKRLIALMCIGTGLYLLARGA